MTTQPISAVVKEIIYPESDGTPMGETDDHRQAMIDLINVLQEYYRTDRLVYVSGDLMFYYEEGNPRAVVSPDVFVVFGVEKRHRRIYKLWEEGVAPALAIEISSRKTKREDLVSKRARYAKLGITEYILFDPLAEYLRPPLRGFRLVGTSYVEMVADETGALESQTLGLRLVREGPRLALFDAQTGERLLTYEQLAEARRMAEERQRIDAEARHLAEERQRIDAEARRMAEERQRIDAEARRIAEERSAALSDENARLQTELARLRAEQS